MTKTEFVKRLDGTFDDWIEEELAQILREEIQKEIKANNCYLSWEEYCKIMKKKAKTKLTI